VVVIGVPDEKWGEVAKALVVLKAGQDASETELIAHVNSHLASYKAPKTVEFLSEFPRGGTGKILKQELKKEYWAGLDKKVN
jgi:acyl-CoA synthetase (AMP-forming)/AMP-acid ligase II